MQISTRWEKIDGAERSQAKSRNNQAEQTNQTFFNEEKQTQWRGTLAKNYWAIAHLGGPNFQKLMENKLTNFRAKTPVVSKAEVLFIR